MELGVIRKLDRMTMSVFEALHSLVGAKRCCGSKISKGGFIKVMSGLKGLMRKGDTTRCLSNGQKGWEGLPCDSKELKAASGLSPRNWRVKGIMS
jgi:hypothetical protein